MSYGFLHRWTEAARSVVIRDHTQHRRFFHLADVESGWAVVDADGVHVGTVVEVESDWITVARGILHRRLYVPRTAIGEVAEGVVRLNAAVASIDAETWAERPRASKAKR